MGDVAEFPGAGIPPAPGPGFEPLPMPEISASDVFGSPVKPRCYGCGHLLDECTCYDEFFARLDQAAEVSS